MRVAIACQGTDVASRFGRCAEFAIYDISGEKILSRCLVPNPGAESGFLPRFLEDMEVDCVIAGGMGVHAHSLFTERGVRVCLGHAGKVEEVVADLISGKLISATGPDNCKGAGDQASIPCVTPG